MKKILLTFIFLITATAPLQTAKADTCTALKIIAGSICTAIVLDAAYNSWPFLRKVYCYCKARPWWPVVGVITTACIYHIFTELGNDIALETNVVLETSDIL
jgi:hypothetical protein